MKILAHVMSGLLGVALVVGSAGCNGDDSSGSSVDAGSDSATLGECRLNWIAAKPANDIQAFLGIAPSKDGTPLVATTDAVYSLALPSGTLTRVATMPAGTLSIRALSGAVGQSPLVTAANGGVYQLDGS